MNSIKLKAFAKINIGLQVLGRRTDGYHNINTIFARTCLTDEIIISDSPALSVECLPPLDIDEKENIVYKATQKLFKQEHLENNNVKISIYKNIPTGAGLGGGSSDAASSLLGLCEFFNITPNKHTLFEIAQSLGSDVPFFLKQGVAAATGRGEILNYFDYSIPYYMLLVIPEIHISTKWAYDNLNIKNKEKNPNDFKKYLINSLKEPNLLKKFFFNDFEIPVFSQYPELANIKDQLYSKGAIYAQMSGSGSTIFGFFHSQKRAEAAADSYSKEHTIICPPSRELTQN